MILIEDIAKEIDYDFNLMTSNEIEYFKDTANMAINISSTEADVLRSIHLNGPLEDGDVSSKQNRDSLLNKGLINKVVVKGQQGYNACNYKGALALRMFDARKKLILTQFSDNVNCKSFNS